MKTEKEEDRETQRENHVWKRKPFWEWIIQPQKTQLMACGLKMNHLSDIFPNS